MVCKNVIKGRLGVKQYSNSCDLCFHFVFFFFLYMYQRYIATSLLLDLVNCPFFVFLVCFDFFREESEAAGIGLSEAETSSRMAASEAVSQKR